MVSGACERRGGCCSRAWLQGCGCGCECVEKGGRAHRSIVMRPSGCGSVQYGDLSPRVRSVRMPSGHSPMSRNRRWVTAVSGAAAASGAASAARSASLSAAAAAGLVASQGAAGAAASRARAARRLGASVLRGCCEGRSAWHLHSTRQQGGGFQQQRRRRRRLDWIPVARFACLMNVDRLRWTVAPATGTKGRTLTRDDIAVLWSTSSQPY